MKYLKKFNESSQSLEDLVLSNFKFLIDEYNILPKSENCEGECYTIRTEGNRVILEIFKNQKSIDWQKIKNSSPKYMNYIFDMRKFIDSIEKLGCEIDENRISHKHKILTITNKN